MDDQDVFVSYGSSPKNPSFVVVPIGDNGIELFSFVIFGWWRKLGRIGGGSRPS